jgi:GDP/UDP-N,N'-diacetylbacillosamine 2-epimerase (hydrolysing)
MRKICVITGSRAEYGLLRWVMQGVKDDPELELKVIATGMHLSPEFGLTYQAIEQDGFRINRKVEMLTSSDTSVGIAKSMGLGLIGFADALHEEQPDLIVVLGDRFEIFVAAQAAMALQIPVAHLAGGDNGAGTFDNIIRHCITKIASLHFVTHEEARRRVIQLGEAPERVFCFGATSVENIFRMPLLSREELERELHIKLEKIVLLVTFHPLTMDQSSAEDELRSLLNVLASVQRENQATVIFTKSNADNGGRAINAILEKFVKQNTNRYLFDSLGQLRYLSMMKQASVVIGNSSSGIYEAPYLQTPTVDIGSRQRGRLAPASVLRCDSNENSIRKAISAALLVDFSGIEMIYGEGNASKKIVEKLKEMVDFANLNIKAFNDLDVVR